MRIRKSVPGYLFDSVNVLCMGLFCLTVIFPFWNLILISLEGAKEMTSLTFKLTNTYWSAASYRYLLFDPLILRAYSNTIIRTLLGTALGVFVCSLGAYTLSKKELPGRTLLTIILLITMFFSGGLIPTFLLIRQLQLYNTFLVLVLPGMVNVFNVLIMRNFFASVDRGVEESALIDGARYLRVLVSIIVPISMPIIATITLWFAVDLWNEWFEALIFTSGNRYIVLQVLIRRMMESLIKQELSVIDRFNDQFLTRLDADNVQAAIILLTIGPIVLLYPFLQRYFVKGIMVGALKA